jgi:preprotein translocase subunit Sss1
MNRTTPAPGEREHWSKYSPTELHRILVEDAVAAHATDLPWAVGAYARIAKLTRKPIEDAFQAVVQEAATLGVDMPMHSGAIR